MNGLRRIPLDDLPGQQEVQREPCSLYVLREEESSYYKLGVAGHPARRLSSLQGGNRRRLAFIAIYAGAKADCHRVEAIALRYFKAACNSEWITSEYPDEVLNFLDAFCREKA